MPSRLEADCQVWCNEAGDYHREDGPAIIWNNGSREWYFNGHRHRIDGPALEYSNGTNYYFIDGKLSSEEDFNAKRKSFLRRAKGFKKTFLNCRGCGSKKEWVVGTSKRSYVCIACRVI
jgi:hypothetical protein